MDKVKDATTKATNAVSDFTQKYLNGRPDGKGPTIAVQLILGILISVVIIFLINLIKVIARRIRNNMTSSPMLIKTTKDAAVLLRVPQNPNEVDSVPLKRSLNESRGIEFTYMTWMYIGDFNYKLGQWKHVFHKGNLSSWPNRGPGVWLHPSVNTLRVYMNTYASISDHMDIADIPLNKWFHFVLSVGSNNSGNGVMDVYINGYLKKRMELSGVVKQNFGDVWVNGNGGFRGYMSRMQYMDYAASYSEIENALKKGPSRVMPTVGSNQRADYLENYWWIG
jgi:hypothetical protein